MINACTEPTIQQVLELSLGTSVHGSVLYAPISDSLVKTGKGSVPSTEEVSKRNSLQISGSKVGYFS